MPTKGRSKARRFVFKQISETRIGGLGILTVSSVHWVVLAFSLVQYLTCKVPEDRPGKNSAICFQVNALFSFKSTRSWSSSGVNLSFGPRGLGAGGGICAILDGPATFEGPAIPICELPPDPMTGSVRAIFEGRGWSGM